MRPFEGLGLGQPWASASVLVSACCWSCDAKRRAALRTRGAVRACLPARFARCSLPACVPPATLPAADPRRLPERGPAASPQPELGSHHRCQCTPVCLSFVTPLQAYFRYTARALELFVASRSADQKDFLGKKVSCNLMSFKLRCVSWLVFFFGVCFFSNDLISLPLKIEFTFLPVLKDKIAQYHKKNLSSLRGLWWWCFEVRTIRLEFSLN